MEDIQIKDKLVIGQQLIILILHHHLMIVHFREIEKIGVNCMLIDVVNIEILMVRQKHKKKIYRIYIIILGLLTFTRRV